MKARDLRPGNSVQGYTVQGIEVNDERAKVLVDVGIMVWVYDYGDEAEDLAYCLVEFIGGNPQPIPHVWETWPKHKLRPTTDKKYALQALAELNARLAIERPQRVAELIAMPWAMAGSRPWY